MRSPAKIGGLWPRCKDCGHEAQAHPENGEHICGEPTYQKCPACGTKQKFPCQCRKYNGPTRREFAILINATRGEIEQYQLEQD